MIIWEKDFTMFSKWALMCMAEQFVYLIYTIPVETDDEVSKYWQQFFFRSTCLPQ